MTLNDPDPLYPNAPGTVLLIDAPYVNAAEQRTSGMDFTAMLDLPLADGVRLTSQLEVTKIFAFDLVSAEGTQHYVGTQGPFQLSSGAGTLAWRGNWQNTLTVGPATISATAYYTSGYRATVEDTTGPGTGGDCASTADLGGDSSFCRTKHFLVVDLVGSYKVSENFTFYANINNLFGVTAPFDLPNYAGAGATYNPTWRRAGVVGRSFRAGARFRF